MAKDVDLFREAMVGVTPLKGRRKAVRKPAADVQSAGKVGLPEPSRPSPGKPPRVLAKHASVVPGPAFFDRDVDRALSKGKRSPESSLDLHGMTLTTAERAVARFLTASAAEGCRVVLIVTGKGTRLEGGRVFGGRIRAEFPGWLERADNRALISGVRAAHPRHGGSGAFYVLLRRRSSANSFSLRATPQR